MAEHSSTQSNTSNLVVLVGEVTHEPERRQLVDGDAWQFDVATTVPVAPQSGPATRCVVPVNWYQPSSSEIALVSEGAQVVVIGTVRRRFFRTGGRTASRTEVVPDRVLPQRRRVAVAKALAAAAGQLSGVGERPGR